MIDTHFTRTFGLLHPFALSPCEPLSGGRLAAAMSRAGGLGMIHTGWQTPDQLEAQFRLTGENAVGWGVDTRRLDQDGDILDQLLGYKPRALLLTGDGLRLHAERIKAASVRLICVVQSTTMTHDAIQSEADVIVAQGNASGGHGPGARSTFALLPEVASMIYAAHAETLLLAAGGISDPRGIAASLIMGADGVMMGTRLWTSREAGISDDMLRKILKMTGDDVAPVPSDPTVGQQWRGIGTPELGQPVGEGVGLIDDMPEIETLLNALTVKTSRLMTHIRRKVID